MKMPKRKVTHYPNCTSDYPEKVKGEPPQHITESRISASEVVRSCVDCGAFVLVRKWRSLFPRRKHAR